VAITDAIVPVAGLGTRLLPATRSQPKEMLPIVDKPVVQCVVEELVRAGIARVLFVTGRRKRAIEDHFDADPELETGPLIDPRTGLQILYTRQARPAGLGDALRYGEGFAVDSEGVVIALGDAIVETPRSVRRAIVPRLIDAFAQTGAAAAIAVTPVADHLVGRYGIAEPAGVPSGTDPFDVADVLEKPSPAATDSRFAVMSRYVLGPAVFAALCETAPDATGEV
jgi:UTP--glucose-1-phosphate uridylyltransferase